MGVPLTKLVRADSLTSISPWQTMVRLDNQTDSQVMVLLAASAANPDPAKSTAHVVPPRTEQGVCSGWYHEPRATVLIRTKLHEAKTLRVPHQTRIIIKLLDHGEGLCVEVPPGVAVEDCANPVSVPGMDTVPMVVRGVSFYGVDPENKSHDAMTLAPLVVSAVSAGEVGDASGVNVVRGEENVVREEEGSSSAVVAPPEARDADLGSNGPS
eukprot:TRINITY_DN61151_c0_g1_i1.p1 TRINITY_DN61151_c0_g1~~TRINITY_DN61151_c0_g1_i1.p1  ORF type:complete len:212 (+),score=37.24 TRINITY_DN61151_c0_g1_i1:125-760(+)